MSFNNGPRTVTTGLSLLVDAADPLSYPGSGTSWTDIVTGIIGSLSGSITYASDFKGALVVNDSSSVIIFPTSSGNFGTDSFTVELAFQPNQINGQHWLISKNSGSLPSWGAFITGSGGSGRVTAFFNASSTVSCSMSTPTGSIVTGSNYLVDINFAPFTGGINTVYINSELSGSITPNGSGSLSATSSLFISNRNSGSSVGSPLEIFNAKLYTPKLVAGRIRQNYNSLSTRLGLPQKVFLRVLEDGLLDSYPGAAAAYSLRLLNSDYGGSAIRVRRSSDNAEQDIGFTTGGGVDTASLLSFVGAGDGFVTTWYDQSGNGLNVTQSSATKQPQIVSSGNIINSNNKPSLYFDATNDVLGISSADATTLALSNITQFIVHKVGASITGYYQMALRRDVVGGNTLNYDVLIDLPTKFFAFYNGSADYRSSVTGSINTQYLTNLIGDVTNDTKVYNNNTLIISQAVKMGNLSVPNGAFNIGNFDFAGSYSEKYMQEVIVYGSKKTADLSNINTSINTYYAIY